MHRSSKLTVSYDFIRTMQNLYVQCVHNILQQIAQHIIILYVSNEGNKYVPLKIAKFRLFSLNLMIS